MKEKLMSLYAAMIKVETKGESTKVMADCIRFVEQCLKEIEEENTETQEMM